MSTTMAAAPNAPPQAESDADVICLWLDGAAPNTRASYGLDLAKFREAVRKPLSSVTVANTRTPGQTSRAVCT